MAKNTDKPAVSAAPVTITRFASEKPEAPVVVQPAPADAPVAPAPADPAPPAAEQLDEDLTFTSKFDLRDPFQGIMFKRGVGTPAKLTSWVQSQMDAGYLKQN